MEPISSKLLLWLLSFASVGRENESSSSEKNIKIEIEYITSLIVIQ